MKTSVFLGIGGAGMKGLAYLLEHQGDRIIGYDNNPEFSAYTLPEALEHIPSADRLVYTDAATDDHPLRMSAQEHGVPQYAYHEMLGEFSRPYETIAITGTHGKSSTTAFVAHIMMQQHLNPTVLVGAHMPTLKGQHAQTGTGNFFVVEADEYRRHFLALNPTYIIITSVDYDHPDAFSSLEDVESAYSEFIQRLQPNGKVIVGEDEYNAHPNISWPAETIVVPTKDTQEISAPLNGNHMRANAALAVALAEFLGVSKKDANISLTSFPGLARRFEHIGSVGSLPVRSDYGHHPAEIAATIAGARESRPNTHIIAIFEAHMPQRLHAFFEDFAQALATADRVIVSRTFVPEGRDATGSIQEAERLSQAIRTHGTPTDMALDDTELAQTLIHTGRDKNADNLAIIFSAGTLDSRMRAIVNAN